MASYKSKILAIDEYTHHHDELIALLQDEGYIIDYLYSSQDLEHELIKNGYYLLIVNAATRTEQVQDILSTVKGNSLLRWLPVLLLTETDSPEERSIWLELGADDCLSDKRNYIELRIRIRNLINKAREFEAKAFRDPLTGVYTRGYFKDRIEFELRRSKSLNSSLSLAFIDADRFKAINDTYGHDVGDLVLQGLSQMIQRNIRSTDVLSRYGGEEFVILMPGANEDIAVERIESILDVAHHKPVATHDEQERFITFSAGVAQWIESQSVDELIKKADDAAYAAKNLGRDQVVRALKDN